MICIMNLTKLQEQFEPYVRTINTYLDDLHCTLDNYLLYLTMRLSLTQTETQTSFMLSANQGAFQVIYEHMSLEHVPDN